jgi:hypothetical protein
MKADDAHRMLASNRLDATPDIEHIELAQRARDRVASRSPGLDQDGLIVDRPAEIEAHVDALRASPSATQMFAEGWSVELVDLTRVCAFQPLVFSDQAEERVQNVNAHDLASIASVTLPVLTDTQMPIQFDNVHQSWLVSSGNPNLRIVGAVGPFVQMPGAPPVLGFAVAVTPSFLQVGRHRGRHYLRDGYHRAYGLLRRGITVVPAFVRDITAFEELVPDPRMMLPQDSYQGQRPPLLVDYLDDEVCASVRVPAMHKMIVIQGLELSPIG